MNGEQLLKARLSRDWEQQEAAARLKVSQPYLSLIEAGKRPVTEQLALRAVRVFNLPPTALPVKHSPNASRSKIENLLASQLAGLGYPKFSHSKKTRKVNPAAVLMSALEKDALDSRTVEALPWLVFNISDMNWSQVVATAKLNDTQNRLGFLLSLAYTRIKQIGSESKKQSFKELLSILEKSRLIRDDSFWQQALTASEKAWLRKNRPRAARHWRVLSNLSADHLVF